MRATGIPFIERPVKPEELSSRKTCLAILASYLTTCIDKHRQNARMAQYLHEYYLGNQDIREKKRAFQSEDKNNNQIVENHAKEVVDFLTDYLHGETVKFTYKSNGEDVRAQADDLSYFNNHLLDSGFHTAQREWDKSMLEIGLGCSYTAARTDIISAEGEYQNFDPDTDAPFVVSEISPMTNFVVYTSTFPRTALFAVSLVNKSIDAANPEWEVDVYIGGYYVVYTEKNGVIDFDYPVLVKEQATRDLPIKEHYCDNDRIGVVAIIHPLCNLVNFIRSNSADAIYDSINKVFVFENVDIDGDQLDEMIENKAINVSSSMDGTAGKANVYTIDISYDHDNVNDLCNDIIAQIHNIVGCPQLSGNTGTGITGSAQKAGGGWANAERKMRGRIIGKKRTDYAQLRAMMNIERRTPNNKVGQISVSNIDIAYDIAQTDDILASAQAASYFYDRNMPEDMILKLCHLSSDSFSDGAKWHNYRAEREAAQAEAEAKKAEQTSVVQQPNASAQNIEE